MTSQQLSLGPAALEPPRGPWTIIKGKRVGRSAGFVARNTRGQLAFFKFDDPDFPGLGTTADVIVSRFLHAAGYNVPEYHSLRIDPTSIALSPSATTLGKYKVERTMTASDLASILEAVPRDSAGRVLAGISVALPGTPKGPFSYEGIRRDDPNDTVRHENRRELRGLRLLMAWFNNTDARRGNTLDVYVRGPHGRRVAWIRRRRR